jgi:hypothetical protein
LLPLSPFCCSNSRRAAMLCLRKLLIPRWLRWSSI